MRVILVLIGLFSLFINATGREENPTAPIDLLKYYSGDFTDSDGDGMTDVAETLYGYDPSDADSFPTYDFFLEDGVVAIVPNDPEIGSATDQIYFRFNKFPDDLKERTRKFLILLMPIMYDILGNPAESFICTFYNREARGSWMSYNNGRSMSCSSRWIPRLLIHELVHAWKGKYGFTSNANWHYDSDLSGFEESAEGLAYVIIHEFIKAYPSHAVSTEMLKMGAWGNWSAKTSTYDLHKHDRFTGAGDFWVDSTSTNTRYNAAAVTAQLLVGHDKYFMKKVLANYYDKITAEPNWRPNRNDLIDLFAEVVPMVNGIDTKDFLNALPVYNGKKLEEGVYPIVINSSNGRDGGQQTIYVAYADKVRGDFWFSYVRKNNVAQYGFPSWFKVFYDESDGYYYADHLNQPFVVDVKTIYGETALTYNGQTRNDRYDGGCPRSFGEVSPSELRPKNFPVGLYKETVTFTEYAKHTSKASEDYYFFGFNGFEQTKDSELVLFIGVDSQVAKDVSIRFADGVESLEFVNGCAIFRSTDMPLNTEGQININVTGTDGRVNVYKRTLINGGSNDDYHQQQFLIIDQDFDGIEDLYDSEVVPLENPSHVTYAEVASKTYDFMIPESVRKPNSPTEFTVEATEHGVVFKWENRESEQNYLKVWNGSTQLMWGGHESQSATINYADFNLVGTEVLVAELHTWSATDETWVGVTDKHRIDLSTKTYELPFSSPGVEGDFHVNSHGYDHSNEQSDESETAVIQVETETGVVVVEDATSVEVTDDNVAIINTDHNVVVVENITEVSEQSEQASNEEATVVISDDSVEVVSDEGVVDVNTTSSVIVVTDTEVVIDDSVDTSNLEIPQLPLVRSIWDSAEVIANDWYYLDWFGYFFKSESSNWIYHSQLGWFYVGWTTTSESVWIYHASMGWCWTSATHFPHVYNSLEDMWMFINIEHKVYFNYTLGKWNSLTEQ